MPFSSPIGKQETLALVNNLCGQESRILDVGCGNGTYARLLHTCGFKDIHGVEVHQPYITEFALKQLYSKVFHSDVMKFNMNGRVYDAAILGDVLEHLSVPDAQELLSRLQERCGLIVVSVPYMMGQGAYGGNVHETHLQPDLTEDVFRTRYPGFKLLMSGKDSEAHIGVWFWRREWPKVLVNVLLKNSEPFIENLVHQLAALNYPRDKMRLLFIENDSEDGTNVKLTKVLAAAPCFENVEILHKSFGFKLLPTERHLPELQVRRLQVLSSLRNEVHKHISDEGYVWNVDHDFFHIPPCTLRRMVLSGGDVVMTPVFTMGGDRYDLGIMRNGSHDNVLDDPEDRDVVEIDECGAAVFYKSEVAIAGVGYDGPLGVQEGAVFCRQARKKGFRVCLMRKEKIFHANVNGMVRRTRPL